MFKQTKLQVITYIRIDKTDLFFKSLSKSCSQACYNFISKSFDEFEFTQTMK